MVKTLYPLDDMRSPIKIKALIVGLAILGVIPLAFAQEESEIVTIEREIQKSAPKRKEKVLTEESKTDDQSLSGLSALAPPSELIVIQKRFLPKTERFQLFGGGTVITNDPFFFGAGLTGRLAYHFTEAWAAEFIYKTVFSNERDVIGELRDRQGITTSAFVTVKNYYGVDAQWTPIFGKMSWINQRIVPFDLYFAGGVGNTITKDGQSAPTLHLGTGQNFGISKSMAFRWDFSWNFFAAKSSAASNVGQTQSFNALFLTAGISFFFPEAKYR